ncbi:putative flavin dependent monooxygenase [Talaromyces proteolyticus]|uniref:Flavin dependent monooxygenase n=1 Tax=Talaromyces proteolyticus TaxID=1131652 RepID=A0AAD4KSG6_9EURO|nr:putative flavin dependent monooxygenase [Talaromyces proteolyticus]KAH8695537.1 putative flavin dependent monooxygenase [Talaromyces proteolyticus]
MRIAVIGAGPCGLAAAKYLRAEKAFANIVIFEQRDDVGGVWYYTPNNTIDDNFSIPHTKPNTSPEKPVCTRRTTIGHHSGSHKDEGILEFLSPAYDLLETNIPHTLMNYSDHKFPPHTPLFPEHAVVKEYLQGYAEDIRSFISFQTQVVNVSPLQMASGDKGWKVTVRDIRTNNDSTHHFDAVVVANGHYSDPYLPDIPGIEHWNKVYPGAITHSKFYRRPEEYRDKKVVIVGNSASGIDLSVQIANVSRKPLLISTKDWGETLSSSPQSELVPEIVEFIPSERAEIRLADGRIERDIDHVVFCTGYIYSFPFLSQAVNPPVVTDGKRPCNLFQHIFYSPRPTLAFVGLPQRIVPFPVSEAQAALIARVFSGRLELPPLKEMMEWEINWIAHHGLGKSFNSLAFPLDAEYINFLHDYSLQARRRDDLANDGKGKIPPYWGEKEKWVRKMFPVIKAASRALGSRRQEITSLEALGFDFEKWKDEDAALKASL